MWREGPRKAAALLLALCVLCVAGGGGWASADRDAGYTAVKAAVAVAVAAERSVPATPRDGEPDPALPPRAGAAPAAPATDATAFILADRAVGPDRHGHVPEARAPPRSRG